MSFGIAATIVGGIAVAGATIYSANQQADAAKQAAGQQSAAAQAGIDEQRRQFDALQNLLKPYTQVGTTALAGQSDLAGLNGPEAQQKAIDAIQNSPQFSALVKQGETGILQNASATGGLRGGNVQGTLAQFRPAMLNQLINDRYSQLGGLTVMGQNSAAGVGTAGQQTANQVSNLLTQQGQAQAGATMAGANANSQVANAVAQLAGTVGGIDYSSLFPSTNTAATGNIVQSGPNVGRNPSSPAMPL